MLNNLRAELVRKELKPEQAICDALGCCPKTAKAKLKGERDFTLPEAFKVVDMHFLNDNLPWAYLFEPSENIDSPSQEIKNN